MLDKLFLKSSVVQLIHALSFKKGKKKNEAKHKLCQVQHCVIPTENVLMMTTICLTESNTINK